ncbi:MAG: hypothetical protein IT442_16715 [Phycisphaeraceae bacterium]|nr:hypothetical protein [Phycisphaeraceae bacterium]
MTAPLHYEPVCPHRQFSTFRVLVVWPSTCPLVPAGGAYIYVGPAWGAAASAATRARLLGRYDRVVIEARCESCYDLVVFAWDPRVGSGCWVRVNDQPPPAAAPQPQKPCTLFDPLEAESRFIRESVTGRNRKYSCGPGGGKRPSADPRRANFLGQGRPS